MGAPWDLSCSGLLRHPVPREMLVLEGSGCNTGIPQGVFEGNLSLQSVSSEELPEIGIIPEEEFSSRFPWSANLAENK